jgi:predicted metal-dependent phosphoesterase TrpH
VQKIIFEKPDLEQIKRHDLIAADMHYHTNHSDSPTKVKDALEQAKQKGFGLAITDHNQISGVIEAYELKTEVLVIPGIEVSARDGPHILVYFYTLPELAEFYERHIHKSKRKSPYLAITLTTQQIVEKTEDYNCLTVAAHPYGYLLFNKGVQKCVEAEYINQDIIEYFDAIEVICGGMPRNENEKAAKLAGTFDKGITGGTDGHLLRDLGKVVTCTHAEDVDGFLTDIMQMRSIVIGREKNFVLKCAMGMVILTKFIKYTAPSLKIHYEQNLPRVKRMGERAIRRIKR